MSREDLFRREEFFIEHGINFEQLTKSYGWREIGQQKNLRGLEILIELALFVEAHSLDIDLLRVRQGWGDQKQERTLDVAAIARDAIDSLCTPTRFQKDRQRGKYILDIIQEASQSYGINEKVFSKFMQPLIKDQVKHFLLEGKIADLFKFMENFPYPIDALLTDDMVNNPGTREAVENAIFLSLLNGDRNNVMWIKDRLLPQPIIDVIKRIDIKISKLITEDTLVAFLNFFNISPFSFPTAYRVAKEHSFRALIKLLKKLDFSSAQSVKNIFEIPVESLQSEEFKPVAFSAFLSLLQHEGVERAIQFRKEYHIKLNYFEEKAFSIFGELLNYNLFMEVVDLRSGKIGNELSTLGVKKPGTNGLLQLEEILRNLKSNFSKHKPESINFEGSLLLSNLFIRYTGFDGSTWGNTSIEGFLNLLTTLRGVSFKPLTEGFEYVETYQISTKDKNTLIEKSLYREDFLDRFGSLVGDIMMAKEILKQKKPFSQIAKEIENIKRRIIERLKYKAVELAGNPKAVSEINNRITHLENIDVRSIKDFQKNFKALSLFKEFDSLIRRVVFAMGFARNKRQLEKSLEDVSYDAPTLDDISWVFDFIDHITNQETMSKYFTDKKAQVQFEKLINPEVFTEQMSILAKNQKTSGKVDITFSTHRDLHTEISGQVGDACWASKYRSILSSFPNFSSILMVKDKGGKYERIVGSCLLIETKASDGSDLLIIRGLNPIENIINSLDVENFFSAIVDYVKKIADRVGAKVAISIDEHSGGVILLIDRYYFTI